MWFSSMSAIFTPGSASDYDRVRVMVFVVGGVEAQWGTKGMNASR